MSQRIVLLFSSVVLCLGLSTMPAYGLEWKNLWSSPEQRAKKKLDSQEYDSLIEQAPNALWRGLGEYQKGDYAKAASSFAEQREQADQAGLADVWERASFNQATAHVRAGEYDQAIDLFDDILSGNPEHQAALNNRDVAQQLKQQEQKQQEQKQQGKDQNQTESQDTPSDDQQNQSPEEKENAGDSLDQDKDKEQASQDSAEQENEEQEKGQPEQKQSEQEQAQEEAQAAEAMEAERNRDAEELGESEGEKKRAGQELQRDFAEQIEPPPLTEREQANEQWLRQIPDDPPGLLQRKIENRHITDFPKVRDSDKPW